MEKTQHDGLFVLSEAVGRTNRVHDDLPATAEAADESDQAAIGQCVLTHSRGWTAIPVGTVATDPPFGASHPVGT
jgi:hypothetical protein